MGIPYHNDHLGGVNLISDLNGLQVQLNEFDPWGKASRSEDNTEPTDRFTGQELDPESGIYYYGGRYYDPHLGRFISPDPFIQDPDDPQNLNRYAYVLNNPQGYIDPSGYFWSFFDDPSGQGFNDSRAHYSDYRDDYAFSCGSSCAGSSQAGSVFTSTGWSASWSGPGLSSAASAGLNLASSYGVLTWGAGSAACVASVWCGVGAAGVAAVGVYNAYDDLSGRGGQTSSFEKVLQSIPGINSNSSAFVAAGIGAIGAPARNLHHALPKFLGGFTEQILSNIPRVAHVDFHKMLAKNLKAAGFKLPVDGVQGSALAWARDLGRTGRQGDAMNVVLETSMAIDRKYHTDIALKVLQNLVQGTYRTFE